LANGTLSVKVADNEEEEENDKKKDNDKEKHVGKNKDWKKVQSIAGDKEKPEDEPAPMKDTVAEPERRSKRASRVLKTQRTQRPGPPPKVSLHSLILICVDLPEVREQTVTSRRLFKMVWFFFY
jgi:hypothetical protein